MDDPNELVPVRHRVTGARAMATRRALADDDFAADIEAVPADETADGTEEPADANADLGNGY